MLQDKAFSKPRCTGERKKHKGKTVEQNLSEALKGNSIRYINVGCNLRVTYLKVIPTRDVMTMEVEDLHMRVSRDPLMGVSDLS